MARALSLAVRNLVFTIVIPGLGGAWLPWWILTRGGHAARPVAWEAIVVIAAGAALYAWCVWNFAVVGRGTPGLWDAPSRVVATGPYRWVRNPIYIAALIIVLGGVPVAAPAGLRGRRGGLLPAVRHRLRRAEAGSPLRSQLPGIPEHSPALDPPPAAAS